MAMSDAEEERAAIVAWLTNGGFASDWTVASLRTRIKSAWVAFFDPAAMPRASCKWAGARIQHGEHLRDNPEGDS
jgi:hypothetical protein